MSFFGTILNRAAVPGGNRTVAAVPKGMAFPLRRAEEDEPEAQPLRRAEPETEEDLQTLRRAEVEEEEEAQALRRQDRDELAEPLRRAEDEEEAAQALRRAEDEGKQVETLRRAEEEEEASPLRRAEEEEEDAQPLRRADEEEPDEAQALRRQGEEEEDLQTLRRAGTMEEEMPDEPSLAQALRRDVSGPAGPGAEAGAETRSAGIAVSDAPFLPEPAEQAFRPAPPPFSDRPRVTIDQIDVVIHEDAPKGGGGSDRGFADLRRRMRTTYLRGL